MDSPLYVENALPSLFTLAVKNRSDALMNFFLPCYFLIGIALANFYNTWLIAFCVGGLLLTAYYSAKILLPNSNLYQYVLSVVLGVFMAQFIYQMHGLFEMHFFAFIGSAVLIIYQNWALQLPMLVLVTVHHAIFSYLQNSGNTSIFFTQLDYFTIQTFVIHILLTAIIFFICGLWSYQLKKFNNKNLQQSLQMAALKKEVQLSGERKQHAEELAMLNKNLQRQAKELAFSNAELEQFAYVASHDLQEPLRTITSFLGLIEKKYTDIIDDKGKQYIHFATDGARRMKDIITDLLEFSRVGKEQHVLEEVDVNTIVSEFLSLYQKQVTEQKASIAFSSLPVIKSRKAPLRQIFQNLLSNGLKYQKKGDAPRIDIAFTETDSHWQFSIADNGIGIKQDYFEKIFVIFNRLHSGADYSGTGIGLAVTKKIVEHLGGEIWLESEEGKGTTFHFTILKS